MLAAPNRAATNNERVMVLPNAGMIAVTGATGLQGGAVVRRLLAAGASVRALTRRPDSKRARALSALGADVVQADMAQGGSLLRAFDGAVGVFSVQNHRISGYAGEVAQGKTVADAATQSGVGHVVYAAAGSGTQTGVGSWDVKVEVAAYMREQQVPMTVLRPMAFMELMTNAKFFPAASTWHVMPKLLGPARPVGWLAVDDLAAVAVKAFTEPQRFIGQELSLSADVLSIEECRATWRDVMGRRPRELPMPVWLFERLAGVDETTMWRWLRSNVVDLDTQATREVHPEALTVRQWLIRRHAGLAGAARLEGEAA